MARRSRLRTPCSTATSSRAAPSAGAGTLLSILVAGSLGVLGACGGSDGDTADDTADEVSNDQADGQADDAGAETETGEMVDPEAVASCLAAAGFEMVTSAELLSEQQVADSLTAFGQTESLTFDATTTAFAGGVSFYETPEQAAQRGENLADVAKAQRVIGNVLINVSAGDDFDEAVAAAEACVGG